MQSLEVPSGKIDQRVNERMPLCSERYSIAVGRSMVGYFFGDPALWNSWTGDALEFGNFATRSFWFCREVAPFWCNYEVRQTGLTRRASSDGVTWIDPALFVGTIQDLWPLSACSNGSHCWLRGCVELKSLYATLQGTSQLHADFFLFSPCPVIVC